MTTHTFTLEALRAAGESVSKRDPVAHQTVAYWLLRIEAALLAAKPEAKTCVRVTEFGTPAAQSPMAWIEHEECPLCNWVGCPAHATIAPPAPGNHPGTPHEGSDWTCPTCGQEAEAYECNSSQCHAGKPDEAPMSNVTLRQANRHLRRQLATRDARIADLERRILRALGCLSEELE